MLIHTDGGHLDGILFIVQLLIVQMLLIVQLLNVQELSVIEGVLHCTSPKCTIVCAQEGRLQSLHHKAVLHVIEDTVCRLCVRTCLPHPNWD